MVLLDAVYSSCRFTRFRSTGTGPTTRHTNIRHTHPPSRIIYFPHCLFLLLLRDDVLRHPTMYVSQFVICPDITCTPPMIGCYSWLRRSHGLRSIKVIHPQGMEFVGAVASYRIQGPVRFGKLCLLTASRHEPKV